MLRFFMILPRLLKVTTVVSFHAQESNDRLVVVKTSLQYTRAQRTFRYRPSIALDITG